jgi:hypothetical protein
VLGVICITYCVKRSLTEAYRIGAEFKNWKTAYLPIIRRFLD